MASWPDGFYMEIQYYIGNNQTLSPYYNEITNTIQENHLPSGYVWYWDAAFTNAVQIGERTDGKESFISGDVAVFGMYGKIQLMDIKLKMGSKTSLPSTKNNGTVYFAKDGDKNFGELYYDDNNGARIKIAPKLSSVTFNTGTATNPEFYINVEDGSKITASMPVAGASQWGVITTSNQDFSGTKGFSQIKILDEQANHFIHSYNGDFLIETDNFMILSAPDTVIIGESVVSLLTGDSEFILDQSNAVWSFYDSIDDNWFTGMGYLSGDRLFFIDGNFDITGDIYCGEVYGNTSTASKLQTPVNINGTAFDGSAAITTQAWGMERTISIDDEAGTTGTKTTGAANITLVIPATMTGFTSITSTTLLATNIGTASNRIGTIRPNSIVLYQSGYTGGTTLARDAASSTAYTLHLPSATGRLVYHTKDTAIGSANAPVYIASTGLATECGAVNVAHGGTGQTTLTSGYALIGNGTSAVSLRAITNITTAGTITSNTNLITANTLNNWKGTTNIVTVGTISSGTWQGTSIKVGYGGTGTTTAPTKGGVIYASSTSAYASTAAGTSGYLLQSGGGNAPSWINATNSNTASTIVKRDSSGNFSAGTITATLSGNATTATTLATTRTIDGINFNGSTNIVHYGTCSTAAATAAKTVSVSGFVLEVGATATVKFSYTNSASNPTLNVNSTGAKSIYYNGAAITSSYLVANRVYTFVYDGTNYLVVGDIDTNSDSQSYKYVTTTNANYPILFNYNNTSTSTSHYSYDRYSTSLYINPSTGALTAPVFVTANYGTADPNTSGAQTSGGVAIKGAGTNGALYFQIVT